MKKKLLLTAATMVFSIGFLTTACSVPEPLTEIEKGIVPEKEATPTIELNYPSNGQSVSVLKTRVRSYVDAMHEQAKGIANDYVLNDLNGDTVKIADYVNLGINHEKSKEIPLLFSFDDAEATDSYEVTLSLNEDLSDAKVYSTTENAVYVDNLYSGKTYYWQVKTADGRAESEVRNFKTDEGFRMISAGGINNVRDMGGRPVKGGKHIKQGLIFRGGEMVAETYTASSGTHSGNLDANSISIMKNDLGVALEIDFRGEEESNYQTASDLGAGVDYVRYSIGGYQWLLTNSHHFEELKNMFLAFGNAENTHVYFHCWGGADRTGTVGFLLGGLLGMSYTDLVTDFELTSFSRNYRPHDVKDPKGVYDFPGLIQGVKDLPYYEEGKEISAIIEDWMVGSLEMTHEQVAQIKANLLED